MDTQLKAASPAPDPTRPAAPRAWSASGVNGTITISGDWITIRKGLVPRSFGIRRDRHVPLWGITAMRWQPATTETHGHLELILADAPMGGLLAPHNGEHTITFTEESAPAFEHIRVNIQGALDARTSGTRTAA